MDDEISATKAEISAAKSEISTMKAKIDDNVAVGNQDSQSLILDKELLALTKNLEALNHQLAELYHQQGEEPGPSKKRRKYSFPSLSNESVSKRAQKSSLTYLREKRKITDHWFAVLLYNTYMYLSAITQKDNDRIELQMDSLRIEIPQLSLKSAIYKAATLHTIGSDSDRKGHGVMASHDLRSSEVMFTCLYARALDHFIFDGNELELGAVLHQGPSRKWSKQQGNPELADIYIAPMKNHEPGAPLLQSDLKLSGLCFDTADKESISPSLTLYSMNGASVRHECETWPVLLGLPGTTQRMELQVHFPLDGKMCSIVITSCNPDDKALLCTLHAAVHYLCNKQIQTQDPPPLIPFKQAHTYNILKPGRVYHNTSTGFVHKIFEKENDATNPNMELLNAVALEEVQKENLTTDGAYFQVKYKYIEGLDIPPLSLKKYAGVAKDLYEVHQLEYIHGDVRRENIIFRETNDKSYLIDFDLARKEGSYYPSGYNAFPVRPLKGR